MTMNQHGHGCRDGHFAALAEERPWEVIMAALGCEARGESLSEDLSEGVEIAGPLLAAASMVNLGCDRESVMRQFVEREFSIRLTYEPTTDEVAVAIEWEDGTSTVAAQ